MAEQIKFLELQLRSIVDNMEREKAEKKVKIKQAYVNKFKITEGMTDEEKKIINENIEKRRERARNNYKKNDEQRIKQIERVKERQRKIKEQLKEQKNKGDNISLVCHNNLSHKT